MKSVKNISRIMERRSFPDFLKAMNQHVDIKEWSEVGGLFNLTMKIFKHYNPDIIIDVGCGKRPTFASLMSLNYKRPVYAIDPQLSPEYGKNLNKFGPFCSNFNDFTDKNDNFKFFNRNFYIVANHSHISKNEIKRFLDKVNKNRTWIYVTVPCCKNNRLDNLSVCYIDKHMHTDKNEIYVFSNNLYILKKLLS